MLVLRMRQSFKPYLIRSVLVIFTICLVVSIFPSSANAAQLDSRSLSLDSVVASATTAHIVTFNFSTTNSVGSLQFEYCTNPLPQVACTSPADLDANAATLAAQAGEVGFSILSQNGNTIVLSRTASNTGTQANSYTFDGIKNPSDVGPFYLRISSYASTDATGSVLDLGSTVGVITQGVNITTEVPPILNFCVGVSIPGECDSASGNFLSLGDFRTNSTTTGTTQFIVGTNAGFGYVVSANGNTMTSGNNSIPGLGALSTSQIGQSQFGINLRANTTPSVGANPSGGSGNPTVNYNSSNRFTFNSGEVIANHTFVSDNEKYTVSYIVNISANQPIGIYNTTLTYLCTATF